MLIGEVSRRVGLPTSTIRYYERLGLLARPAIESGRRQYTKDVLDRIAVISFARSMGFRLVEIDQLLLDGKPYSTRLHELARSKLAEVEAMVARAETMKTLLRKALRCGCVDATECGRRIRATS